MLVRLLVAAKFDTTVLFYDLRCRSSFAQHSAGKASTPGATNPHHLLT